jgi:hypothetical protein
MNTASKLGPHTNTSRATCPVWGSAFTTKAAKLQGDSAEFLPSSYVVAFGSFIVRARVLVHEVSRAKELAERRLAERRRAYSADHASLV